DLVWNPSCFDFRGCPADQACVRGACTPIPGTRYPSLNPSNPIPDCIDGPSGCTPSPLVSTLMVGTHVNISSLDLYVDIQHTYRGDLRIHLTPPTGSTVLVRDQCGDCQQDIHAVFPAEIPFTDAAGAARFAGLDAFATWTLTVTD